MSVGLGSYLEWKCLNLHHNFVSDQWGCNTLSSLSLQIMRHVCHLAFGSIDTEQSNLHHFAKSFAKEVRRKKCLCIEPRIFILHDRTVSLVCSHHLGSPPCFSKASLFLNFVMVFEPRLLSFTILKNSPSRQVSPRS